VSFESPDSASTTDRPPGASTSRRAYDYVKDRLLDGRFAGGTLLSENDIAQRLGCSRTPVRQAFVELQGEGLLDLYPRRGGLVVPVSPTEADDVLEARLLLEPYCSRRAAVVTASAGAVLAAELEAALAEQMAALDQGQTGFVRADRRFHRAIVAATGNVLLVRQYDALRDRHQRIAAATLARDPARIERFIAEHRAIAAALAAGDSDAAAELTSTHLHTAHELARRSRY
jgi:DNA-binding GntR family transcriptional regulator